MPGYPKTRFKYGRGDRVSCPSVGGKWMIYSPSPKNGHYYLEPQDKHARALASLLPHGMLEATVREIEPRPLTTQETLTP